MFLRGCCRHTAGEAQDKKTRVVSSAQCCGDPVSHSTQHKGPTGWHEQKPHWGLENPEKRNGLMFLGGLGLKKTGKGRGRVRRCIGWRGDSLVKAKRESTTLQRQEFDPQTHAEWFTTARDSSFRRLNALLRILGTCMHKHLHRHRTRTKIKILSG